MYDAFSEDYDRFVNWPARLNYELPFIDEQLQKLSPGTGRPLRVLDAACGTGMHAIALANRGYRAAGADLSPKMIERARANAEKAGTEVEWVAVGFGDLAQSFRDSQLFPFDALLCLGNSLPHLLDQQALARGLADFAACLRPGGLLLIQNRNFDAVLSSRERWMEPQSKCEGDREWIFLRFYDFDEQDRIIFNILTLKRKGQDAWQQSVISTPLHPLRYTELSTALSAAGFTEIDAYGDLSGSSFLPAESGNLVTTARKSAIIFT